MVTKNTKIRSLGIAALVGASLIPARAGVMNTQYPQPNYAITSPANAKINTNFFKDSREESKISNLETQALSIPQKISLDFSDPVDLLATLAYEEGRDCSKEEKLGIIYTAINRLKSGEYGNNLIRVTLAPLQYSCFNSYNPKIGKTIEITENNIEDWNECLEIARGVLSGEYSDPTGGATHYFNPQKVSPQWQHDKNIKRIRMSGKTAHNFFRYL
jgi:spore germination cell wall hydrolase CwlJ-like protein